MLPGAKQAGKRAMCAETNRNIWNVGIVAKGGHEGSVHSFGP